MTSTGATLVSCDDEDGVVEVVVFRLGWEGRKLKSDTATDELKAELCGEGGMSVTSLDLEESILVRLQVEVSGLGDIVMRSSLLESTRGGKKAGEREKRERERKKQG